MRTRRLGPTGDREPVWWRGFHSLTLCLRTIWGRTCLTAALRVGSTWRRRRLGWGRGPRSLAHDLTTYLTTKEEWIRPDLFSCLSAFGATGGTSYKVSALPAYFVHFLPSFYFTDDFFLQSASPPWRFTGAFLHVTFAIRQTVVYTPVTT